MSLKSEFTEYDIDWHKQQIKQRRAEIRCREKTIEKHKERIKQLRKFRQPKKQ